MKIGIITLPFNTNYGGILQAYALQSALKQLGHEVWTVNRITEGMSLKMKVLSYGRRSLLKLIGKKNVVVRTWPTPKEQLIISEHTSRFIEENIRTTGLLNAESEFNDLRKFNFEAYVVGSDQVWRPKYSPSLKNHFLGFIDEDSHAKRISFAASFGVDHWEYTPEQTKICRDLAKKFDAISVREDSGINLCKEYLEVNSVQSIDPTMLISKEEYIALVEKDKIPKLTGTLVAYVLDLSEDKKQIIETIRKELNLELTSTMPEGSFRELGKNNLKKCIFPPLTNWIRGFMDAEFVITDSFHGTVFSILFNKPFLSIGNKKRGMTRFNSLLKMFELEDRLIYSNADDVISKVRTKIDFSKVNAYLNVKKAEAFSYLKTTLSE